MTDKAYLYPDADMDLSNSVYVIQQPGVDIGRSPDSTMTLPIESVSRQHAKITFFDGRWTIEDLSSSNGTFVNGERISSPHPLDDGDIVTLGKATFTFSTVAPDPTGANPEPEHTSDLRLVGDEEDSSVILSTQVSDQTPFKPGAARTAKEHLDQLNQRLLALYRLSDILRGALRRDQILTALLELIFENLPADRGVALRVDEETDDLVPELFRYREGEVNREFVLSKSITRRVVTERVAVLSRDVRMDSRFQASESIMVSDTRSAMCVPLAGKRDLMGLVFLDTRESVHAFTEEDLAFVSALATDAAMTLENLALLEENIRQERLAAVGQTISGLAHNIKNILQLARGGLELTDRAIQTRNFDDMTTLWPITRRSIERMQALTQEMLDFSRQSKPQLRQGDVNQVVLQIVEIVQSDTRAKSVQLTTNLGDGCCHPAIDPDGLSKALMNLISNAFDAMQGRQNAEVLVVTENARGHVMLRVKDNGPGIPPHLANQVFQPFFSTKGSKGNGLGLAMTRKYVEDMHGRLDLKSEPGHGCEFVISLPV